MKITLEREKITFDFLTNALRALVNNLALISYL